jgi:hypothetical protein
VSASDRDGATVIAADVATVGEQKTGEAGQQCALASAVRPKQTKYLSRFDAKRRRAKGFDLAEALVQMVD